MTSPLFLVPPGELFDVRAGSTLTLDGSEGRHAATVRRLQPGEPVDVADGAGELARCTVVQAGIGTVELRVLDRASLPEPDPRLVLVQALAKGDRDDQAVEAATELGVDEVVPWQAERSIVVWRGERAGRSRRKWEQTVRTAAKQSRRPRVPVVADLATLPALEQRVAAAAAAYVLHEAATVPLVAVVPPSAGEVLVVVGPEGGISAPELDRLVAAGAQVVRLGTEVLRSSTAGPAALAVLSAAARWR